jgi:hypothetical protein
LLLEMEAEKAEKRSSGNKNDKTKGRKKKNT